MIFAWPYLLILLPLPWLLKYIRPKQLERGVILNHPYLSSLASGEQGIHTSQPKAQTVVTWLTWCFIVLSIIRPQFVGEPISNPISGRSLMLTVDLSGSMRERDMEWNGRSIERYQAVQAVVSDFADKRKGDFLGLVVFGSFADIQAPLTPDVTAVKETLFDLRPGMAGDSTAIGDGLALSVKRLREMDTKDKTIILLSDGENTAGDIEPMAAAEIAKQSDIKVYTIGFGGNYQSSLFGLLNQSNGAIDEQTLLNIATETNGEYFRATSTAELEKVFQIIDALETSERVEPEKRIINELFWIPLGVSLLVIMLGQFFVSRQTGAVR